MATAWAGYSLKPADFSTAWPGTHRQIHHTYTHTHLGFSLFRRNKEDQNICPRQQRAADWEHTSQPGDLTAAPPVQPTPLRMERKVCISPKHMLGQTLPEGTQARLAFLSHLGTGFSRMKELNINKCPGVSAWQFFPRL